jgi:hypothetical protein
VVYAYGAVIKAGELHGAQQSASDTLPLIPLEQLLVLGIHRLLPAGITVLIALLIGMAYLDRPNPPKKTVSTKRTAFWGRVFGKWPLRISAMIIVVFLAVAAPWTIFLLLAEMAAVLWYAQAEHTTMKSYGIFAFSAIAIFFAASAWFDPHPLAQVTLRTIDHRSTTGDLIAKTSSTWYVGVDDKKWTALEAGEITHSQVSAVERKENESVYHALTGHRLLGLGPE